MVCECVRPCGVGAGNERLPQATVAFQQRGGRSRVPPEEFKRERDRRARDKAAAERASPMDPLLKKVMSKVFTKQVLEESLQHAALLRAHQGHRKHHEGLLDDLGDEIHELD
jgi:hypothetical protein